MQGRPATGEAMQRRIEMHSSLESLAFPQLSRTDGDHAKHPGVNSLPVCGNSETETSPRESNQNGQGLINDLVADVRTSHNLCGVEMWRDGLGAAYLLPTLSLVGTSRARARPLPFRHPRMRSRLRCASVRGLR